MRCSGSTCLKARHIGLLAGQLGRDCKKIERTPEKTLGYRTPAEMFDECAASTGFRARPALESFSNQGVRHGRSPVAFRVVTSTPQLVVHRSPEPVEEEIVVSRYRRPLPSSMRPFVIETTPGPGAVFVKVTAVPEVVIGIRSPPTAQPSKLTHPAASSSSTLMRAGFVTFSVSNAMMAGPLHSSFSGAALTTGTTPKSALTARRNARLAFMPTL
jgi:hypothetical protein